MTRTKSLATFLAILAFVPSANAGSQTPTVANAVTGC